MEREYVARDQYRGATASQYLDERKHTAQWRREHALVASILRALPREREILDLPFGTGRFVGLYAELGHRVFGVDVSPDMLSQARAANADFPEHLRRLALGEAESLPLGDRSVDCVVSTRFFPWLPAPVMERVAGEIARVARHTAIVEVDTAVRVGRLGLVRAFLRDLVRAPVSALRVLGGAARLALAGRTTPRLDAAQDYHYHAPDSVERVFAALGLRMVSAHRVRGQLRYLEGQDRELRVYHFEREGWKRWTGARVIELAGLPGAGKSTASAHLAREDAAAGRRPLPPRRLGSSRWRWALVPVAAARLHAPLRLLLAAPGEPRLGVVGLTIRVAAALASRGRRDGPDFSRLRLLAALGVTLGELTVSRLRARLSGRTILIDEGLVQVGIGAWICAQPEHRDAFWRCWMATLPRDTRCVVLRCAPLEALRRCARRPQGQPWVLAQAEMLQGRRLELGSLYEELDALVRGDELRLAAACIQIEQGSRARVRGELRAEVTERLEGAPFDVWPRLVTAAERVPAQPVNARRRR